MQYTVTIIRLFMKPVSFIIALLQLGLVGLVGLIWG